MILRYTISILLFAAAGNAGAQVNKIKYDTSASDYRIEELHEEDVNDKGHFHTPPAMQKSMMSLGIPPPEDYPFKPCNCEVIHNLPAMYPDDPKSNIGFEEEEEKGVSNWVFFMGMNRAWAATIDNHASFMCNRYYTGAMVNEVSGTVENEAFYWNPQQETDFETRTKVMQEADELKDDVGGFPVTPPSEGVNVGTNNHSLRLNVGDILPGLDNYNEKIWGSYNPSVMAVRKLKIKKSDPLLTYKYALALSNYFGHASGEGAYFRVQVFKYKEGEGEEADYCEPELCCESLLINAEAEDATVPGIKTNEYRSVTWGKGGQLGIAGNSKYKEWTTNVINFERYMDPEEDEAVFIIAFTASYCKGNHDFGYAYIDLEAKTTGITYTGGTCDGAELSFKGPRGNSYKTNLNSVDLEEHVWSVEKDGHALDLEGIETNTYDFKYAFDEPGDYKVILTILADNTSGGCVTRTCDKTLFRTVTIQACSSVNRLKCNDCINSFAPIPGQPYVLSAWVKQKGTSPEILTTYSGPEVKVTYDGDDEEESCVPSGPIIDGWQKIEHAFTIPAGATDIHIDLKGSTTADYDIFYDDIRFFPFYGNMKSFVYDPNTQKLMAELDENNFSTFYEYDEEGKLKRIKKETERGVMTVKEAGNNSSNK